MVSKPQDYERFFGIALNILAEAEERLSGLYLWEERYHEIVKNHMIVAATGTEEQAEQTRTNMAIANQYLNLMTEWTADDIEEAEAIYKRAMTGALKELKLHRGTEYAKELEHIIENAQTEFKTMTDGISKIIASYQTVAGHA
jgi:hypothetical protein